MGVGARVVENEKKAWTFPPKSIDFWYHTSVGLAIVAAAAILPVIYYIFSAAGNSALVDERVKLTTALGTSLGVLLTFSTVVWRGLVGEAQANEQKRANDAKEEDNRSILFHKGLELISQGDTQGTNVAAGITTLELVASVKASQFSQLSTDALADYIIKNFKDESRTQSVQLAHRALQRGIKRGTRSNRDFIITYSNPHEKHTAFFGFRSVTYQGGYFADNLRTVEYDQETFQFNRVKFERLKFGKYSAEFDECSFYKCSFSTIDLHDILFNEFELCNFSNSSITSSADDIDHISPDMSVNLRESLVNCYFHQGQPPNGVLLPIILDILDENPPSPSSRF